MAYRAKVIEAGLDTGGHQLSVKIEYFGDAGEPSIIKTYNPEAGTTAVQFRDETVKPYIAKLNALRPALVQLQNFIANATIITE